MAGISSMPALDVWGFYLNYFETAVNEMNRYSDVKEMIASFELGVSNIFASILAAQTNGRQAHLVQSRDSKIVSKLPKSALWVLVSATCAFILSGIVLAVLAFTATSPEVHQVHTRLTTAGLAAEAFEKPYVDCVIENDEDLFQEFADEKHPDWTWKRVGVKTTETGATVFDEKGGKGAVCVRLEEWKTRR